jgi:hypothetical protein
LLCVGVAYFLIGVIVPVAALSAQGSLSNFNTNGLIAADHRRRARRRGRRLHHLGVQGRRAAALRDAVGLRRRADRERCRQRRHPSAQERRESDALRRLPAGVRRRGDGALLQADA